MYIFNFLIFISAWVADVEANQHYQVQEELVFVATFAFLPFERAQFQKLPAQKESSN